MLSNLQSTVNRTAEHLNKSSSSRNVEYLTPSNATTVVHERRSVSPLLVSFVCYAQLHALSYIYLFFPLDGCMINFNIFQQKDGKVYKSSSYEYSSSSRTAGGGTIDSRNLATNVNQLDNLLDDLKHDRGNAFESSLIE